MADIEGTMSDEEDSGDYDGYDFDSDDYSRVIEGIMSDDSLSAASVTDETLPRSCRFSEDGCSAVFTTIQELSRHEKYCGWNSELLSDRQENGIKCQHCEWFALEDKTHVPLIMPSLSRVFN